MTVKMSNDNFRISLHPNKNLPQELDLDPILKIILEATEVLKEDYQQLIEELVEDKKLINNIDYKEEFLARIEDNIFLWFHKHAAFKFLNKFLDRSTKNFFQQIEDGINHLLQESYSTKEVENLKIRVYELSHNRKFFEIFPTSKFSLRPGLRQNSFIITWNLENENHSEQGSSFVYGHGS